CKRSVSVPEKGVIPEYGGPEYETVSTFGSYCCVDDLGDIALANQLCNMYGVDTITAGASIAFAMECYENGLITDDMTDGVQLKFGDGSVFPKMFEQIIYRKTEVGRLLAEGSYRASLEIGRGAEKFFMGVKGQEFPAHMPQFKHNLGLHYSVNTCGADHMSADHDPNLLAPPDSEIRRRLAQFGIWKGYSDTKSMDDEKVRFTYVTECLCATIDTLCFCLFAFGPSFQLYGFEDICTLAKCGLGVDMGMPELLTIGERKVNMFRYFNYMAGLRPKKDDTLPDRIFVPIPDGPAKGADFKRDEWEHAKEVYYEIAGSDPESGRPADAVIKRLSLQWLTELYKA
ncbi:MAG: aldehyde ferredoxin oxidoreductase C-terminal domain-containing protein, partial [Oscillospiraceae bacterium]